MISALVKGVRHLGKRRHPRMLIGYGSMYLIYSLKRIWVRDQVIVSPTVPRDIYSLWKISRLSGIKLISENSPEARSARHILAHFRHHNDTWDEVHPSFVNGDCTDISKSHVDAMFGMAFGYTTRIDPTTFNGRAVMKSELNYSGGGVFVECPLDPSLVRPDHIYQKLIDNETSPGVVKEYRVSVICGHITDVIVQYRSIDRRLTGRGSGGGRGSLTSTAEKVFSPLVIDRLIKFCAMMKLDFGELDVLPDVNDGQLYVLDANKTPSYMVDRSAFRIDRFLNAYRRGKSFKRLLRARRAAGSNADNYPAKSRGLAPIPKQT